MKKIVLLIMVISGLGILSAQAQGGAFGAKATPMLSWAKTVNNDSYNFESEGVVPSIGFGPSFKKYFGENFNVDVSLLFTWQKSKFTATPVTQFGNPKSYSVLTKLQYVQIPVIFEASFPITGGLRGMIDFGASPAIELNSMADISDISDGDEVLLKQDYDYKGSVANLYLNAGAGVSYDITDALMVSAVAMYNNGIIDVWYDDEEAVYLPSVDLHNHFMSLNIGLHIKF